MICSGTGEEPTVVVAPEPPKPEPKSLGDEIKGTLTNCSDVVFSFDTTGSMYPCIQAVRRDVEKTCDDLFELFPGLRIGIITHGDYCDGQNKINALPLTDDRQKVKTFIQQAPLTGGGDAPECYELALRTARDMGWFPEQRSSMLVLIGDDEPHPTDYYYNDQKLDWIHELAFLRNCGVKVFPVQCLYSQARSAVNAFWTRVAELAGTRLFQFSAKENFGQYSTPVFAGLVAAAGGSESYACYTSSPIGMTNTANLSPSIASGMMCAARSFDALPVKSGDILSGQIGCMPSTHSGIGV